jgi:hypothetical protein
LRSTLGGRTHESTLRYSDMTWQNPVGTLGREFDEIWDIRRIPATPSMATASSAIGTSRVAHLNPVS